jgi:N-methylhydantoinase A
MRMTLAEAAVGIRRIVDMRMADEVRVFAARRGVDLSEFALLPFGGAGAVHAAAVAEELGMRRIIVPARPGAFSALGLLCTDVLHDYIRSELCPLDRLDATHADVIFRELEAKAATELAEEGLDPSMAVFERDLDMRYAGQGYELRVPLSGLWRNALDAVALSAARERFDDLHERIHGHAAKEKGVEVVSYRLRVRVRVPKFTPKPQEPCLPAPLPREAIKGTRAVFFSAQAPTDTTIYDRDRLGVGASFSGPAIVEQFDATTVVPVSWQASVDRYGNLILERSG